MRLTHLKLKIHETHVFVSSLSEAETGGLGDVFQLFSFTRTVFTVGATHPHSNVLGVHAMSKPPLTTTDDNGRCGVFGGDVRFSMNVSMAPLGMILNTGLIQQAPKSL